MVLANILIKDSNLSPPLHSFADILQLLFLSGGNIINPLDMSLQIARHALYYYYTPQFKHVAHTIAPTHNTGWGSWLVTTFFTFSRVGSNTQFVDICIYMRNIYSKVMVLEEALQEQTQLLLYYFSITATESHYCTFQRQYSIREYIRIPYLIRRHGFQFPSIDCSAYSWIAWMETHGQSVLSIIISVPNTAPLLRTIPPKHRVKLS